MSVLTFGSAPTHTYVNNNTDTFPTSVFDTTTLLSSDTRSSMSTTRDYNPIFVDYWLPCYIENLERNNINPTDPTNWYITAWDNVAKTITVDQELPRELADASTDLQDRWFLTCEPGCWAYIDTVDFETNTITYIQVRGSTTVGKKATWNNPFRSTIVDPERIIVGVSAWATWFTMAGPSWIHSDGTYRLVSNGYNGSYNTSTLYSSPDLLTWTAVGGTYKYRAGVHPFDESWCTGAINHNTYGDCIKIKDGVYAGNYMNLFQGLNASSQMHCAAVIFDEDFNIVYMPSSPLVIPGYVPDASDKYNIASGVYYYNDKIYATISYRHLTPDNIYKVLLCELSGVVDPTVLSTEELYTNNIPNCWASLSAPGGPIIIYKDIMYQMIGGENNTGATMDTPLASNFEVGCVYGKPGGPWNVHPSSPLIMNAVAMDDVYTWSYEMSDAVGVFGSTLRVGDTLHMFIGGKYGTNTYRIWKYKINLPE